ncbi:MAG: hypothetical protein ACYTDY_00270 [Planctomycetota bacterium]
MNKPLLVLSGAAALALVVTCVIVLLTGPDGEERGIEAGRAADIDPALVEGLRQQVARLENRVRELESSGIEGGGLTAEDVLMAALREPSPELDELVAAAVARVGERKAKGPGDEAKLGDRAAIAKYVASIESELDRWSEEYGLSSGQVEELKSLTKRSIDRVVEAKASGAGELELRALGVEAQAEVRRIVGDRIYRATERDRLHRETRGKLFWLSAAVGGLSDEQHSELDRAIEAGVESSLADVVRLRSEPLPEREYDTTLERLRQAQAQRWKHIRHEILTEAQRRRIPGK